MAGGFRIFCARAAKVRENRRMLRLTEIRLPIDHAESALQSAVLKRLGIPAAELKALTVHQRAVDARKPGIVFTYSVCVEVGDEPAVLKRLHQDRHVAPAPDMTYHAPVRAPVAPKTRPVVIGT